MLLMTAVIAAVSFTSCDDDFDDQDARWYLTGIVYPPRDGYGPTTLYYSRLY